MNGHQNDDMNGHYEPELYSDDSDTSDDEILAISGNPEGKAILNEMIHRYALDVVDMVCVDGNLHLTEKNLIYDGHRIQTTPIGVAFLSHMEVLVDRQLAKFLHLLLDRLGKLVSADEMEIFLNYPHFPHPHYKTLLHYFTYKGFEACIARIIYWTTFDPAITNDFGENVLAIALRMNSFPRIICMYQNQNAPRFARYRYSKGFYMDFY